MLAGWQRATRTIVGHNVCSRSFGVPGCHTRRGLLMPEVMAQTAYACTLLRDNSRRKDERIGLCRAWGSMGYDRSHGRHGNLSRTQRKPRWQGSTLQLEGGRRSCRSSASASHARPRLASRANSSSMHRRMLEFWAPMARRAALPRRRARVPAPVRRCTLDEGGRTGVGVEPGHGKDAQWMLAQLRLSIL